MTKFCFDVFIVKYSRVVTDGERFKLRPPFQISPSLSVVPRSNANDDIRIGELPLFIRVYCLHPSGAEEQDHRKNLRNFIWHSSVNSANQTGWWGPNSLWSKKCFRHVARTFPDHTEFSGSLSRDQTFPAWGNVKSLLSGTRRLFQHVEKTSVDFSLSFVMHFFDGKLKQDVFCNSVFSDLKHWTMVFERWLVTVDSLLRTIVFYRGS